MGVYRQFCGKGGSVEKEHSEMDALCEEVLLASEEGTIILTGDFNLDMKRRRDSSYKYHSMFNQWMDTVSMAGLVWVPTKDTWTSTGEFNGSHHTSTLDHTYISERVLGCTSVQLLSSRPADHAPMLIQIDGKGKKKPRKLVLQRRNYRHINYGVLNSLVGTTEWLPASSTMEDLLEQYDSVTLQALDKVAPLQDIQVREGVPLYLEHDTRAAMAERDQSKPNKKWRALRNKVNRLVKRDHMTSAKKALERGCDPWQLINSMLGKESNTLPLVGGALNSQEAADKVNRFYIEKPERLRQGLPDIDKENLQDLQAAKKLHARRTDKDIPTFELHTVGVATIKNVIQSLNTTMAAGTDQIPITIIKRCLGSMAQPLCHIINASISEGCFPDRWRTAIVHPIFKGKGKDREAIDSYRPVSILCAASKVLEKVVERQLLSHMDECNLLPDQQHGFRKHRSTDTALTRMTHFLESARQRKEKAFVASFDFSAAFDTVDPKVVAASLKKIGAGDLTMKWFTSYLLPGRQQVKWNEALSGVLLVRWGVRQGSILGPVLFIIVTRDTAGILLAATELGFGQFPHASLAVLYADDSTLGVAAQSTTHAVAALTLASNIMVKYATELGLSINTDKTQFLSMAHGEHPLLRVRYDYMQPGPLNFLGVKISATKGLVPFAEDTSSALCRTAGIVHNLSARLPPHLLSALAGALGVGKAQVSVSAANTLRILDNDPVSLHTARLQKSLNKIARSVLGKRCKDKVPVERLMDKCKFPSINRMVAASAGLFAWQAVRGGGVLHDLFRDLYHTTGTRAASTELLKTPIVPCRSVLNAVKVWNHCPALREAKTAHTARTILKKWARALPL
jgi:hypothetical protein